MQMRDSIQKSPDTALTETPIPIGTRPMKSLRRHRAPTGRQVSKGTIAGRVSSLGVNKFTICVPWLIHLLPRQYLRATSFKQILPSPVSNLVFSSRTCFTLRLY